MVSVELARKKRKAAEAGLSTWVWMKTQYPEYYCTHTLAAYARRRAKKSGVPCIITAKDIAIQFNKQKGICPLTGIKMKFGPGMSMANPTVDRKITARGYVPSNIRIVCFWANISRHNMTDKEFRMWCVRVMRNV